MLQPAGVRAQTPTVSGMQIHPSSPAAGPRITLDGPRPGGTSAVIYVDGRRTDSTVLTKLRPDTIASVGVLKDGDIAGQLGPDEARLGILFITTKTGQHMHRVRAFNRRLGRLRRAEVRAASGSVAPQRPG